MALFIHASDSQTKAAKNTFFEGLPQNWQGGQRRFVSSRFSPSSIVFAWVFCNCCFFNDVDFFDLVFPLEIKSPFK